MGGRGGRGYRGGDQGAQRQQQAPPLRGAALYDAEAAVLGRFLSIREGAPLIGQLVDAQIKNQSVASVLAGQAAGPKTVDELDADWRQWLSVKGASTKPK